MRITVSGMEDLYCIAIRSTEIGSIQVLKLPDIMEKRFGQESIRYITESNIGDGDYITKSAQPGKVAGHLPLERARFTARGFSKVGAG